MNKEYIYIREGQYFVCNPFCEKVLKEEQGETELLKSKYPKAILIDTNILREHIENKNN